MMSSSYTSSRFRREWVVRMSMIAVEVLLSRALELNLLHFLNFLCKMTFLQVFLFNFLQQFKPLKWKNNPKSLNLFEG
ncbi:hypothetical protein Hanom_Chr03g00230601 [Helianthus anomalus]